MLASRGGISGFQHHSRLAVERASASPAMADAFGAPQTARGEYRAVASISWDAIEALRHAGALERMLAVGTGTSPHRRGVGKTLPGLQDPGRIERAAHELHGVEVVGGEHLAACDCFLSAPTPCSPVIAPPASMQ